MTGIVRSSLALGAALLLGRVFGFLREVLLAARAGVSAEADIAVVALTLPDFLIGLLLAGGFGAALVPALRRAEGAARARLFRFVATLAVVLSALLAAALALSPGLVFSLLAPALTDAQTGPHLGAMRVIALSVPLAALAGVVGAYLNARSVFFVVGLGTVVYNLVLCTQLALLPAGGALIWPLTLGIVAAGVLRTGMLMLAARAPLRPLLRRPPEATAALLRLFAAGVLATGIMVFAHILFRTVAALGGPGELAAFAYALKLFELPTAILFAPIATVLLPRLADMDAPGDLAASGLAALLVLSLATLATGLVAGEALARLIFLRGEMTEAGLTRIVALARIMFLALPFAALAVLGAAWLNAQRRTGRVLGHVALALLVGGGLALLRPDWVMAGFVAFHAVLAALNLSVMPGALRAVPALIGAWRLAASLGIVAVALALDRLALPPDATLARAALGLGLWLALILPFADRLRGAVRRR